MNKSISTSKTILFKSSFYLLIFFTISCQPAREKKLPNTKPNVLFIIVDDLKPLLGAYDDPYVKSPNIDNLARRGVVFRRNYCQQAICGPSRANLLTGMRPDHTKVWDLATKMRDVHPDILTMPQYFKENGYETAGIGKVFDKRCVDKDLDKPSWSIPFFKKSLKYYADESTIPGGLYQDSLTLNTISEFRKKAEEKNLSPSDRNYFLKNNAYPTTECLDLPDHAYIDGAKVAHAKDIMKNLSSKEKPFFLAVGITKPHLPFTAPKKYWDLYDREELPLAEFRENSKNTPKVAFHRAGEISKYKDIHPIATFSKEKEGMELPLDKQKELIHGYYAAVSFADAQVGKLTAMLDTLKIADNTIVVVVGDHGWHLGDHNLWCKHSNFENAVQTPLIISTPGLDANQNFAMSEFVDIFPTLCELSHLKIPENLDGKSLVPAMKDPNVRVKEFAISQYPRSNEIMGYSLRTAQYRYTIWMENNYRSTEPFDANLMVATELYDYKNDPLEKVNVASDMKYESIAKELHAKMLSFIKGQN